MRTVDEIIAAAKRNILSGYYNEPVKATKASINSKPMQNHTDVLKEPKSKFSSTGKDKYLKKQRRRNKSK